VIDIISSHPISYPIVTSHQITSWRNGDTTSRNDNSCFVCNFFFQIDRDDDENKGGLSPIVVNWNYRQRPTSKGTDKGGGVCSKSSMCLLN